MPLADDHLRLLVCSVARCAEHLPRFRQQVGGWLPSHILQLDLEVTCRRGDGVLRRIIGCLAWQAVLALLLEVETVVERSKWCLQEVGRLSQHDLLIGRELGLALVRRVLADELIELQGIVLLLDRLKPGPR